MLFSVQLPLVCSTCLRFAIPPTLLCDCWLRGRVAELLGLLTGCIVGWRGGWAAGLLGEGRTVGYRPQVGPLACGLVVFGWLGSRVAGLLSDALA